MMLISWVLSYLMMLFQKQKLHDILRDGEMIMKDSEVDCLVRLQDLVATSMKHNVFWNDA
jgi:hypothetical protein